MWICLFGGAQTLLSAKVNALKKIGYQAEEAEN